MPAVQAQTAPRIFLNDRLLALKEPAFVQNSILYLPIQVVEQMGFQLHLDPIQHSARILRPEKFFSLKAGSRYISWDQKTQQIAHAPIWQENTLFVPRSLFVNLGVILSYSRFHNEVRLSADLNRLQNIQIFPNDVYTRLVFQFSQKPVYQVEEHGQEIWIDLKGVNPDDSETHVPDVQDSLLQGIQVETTGNASMRLRIKKAYAAPHKLYWLDSPQRLMIDLVKIFQESHSENIGSGLKLTHFYQGFSFGPEHYYTVVIPPGAPVKLYPALAQSERGFSKDKVSDIAARYGALVGINATYFNHQGIPLGTLMQDRELISSPIYGRTLFAILKNGFSIEANSRSLGVLFPAEQKSFAFNAVNLPRQNQQIVLYTPHFGYHTGTQTEEQSVECQVLLDGTISQIGEANLSIPEDGFVISAQGAPARWLKANLKEGERALIFSGLWEQWRNARHLVAGGPRLLKDGQLQITAQAERFQPDIAQGRSPRTALGLGANGEIIILVADGRTAQSRGLSLTELAQLMQEQGATDALNFDGGGSSTLVVRNRVINRPSDGSERAVASALLVLPDP